MLPLAGKLAVARNFWTVTISTSRAQHEETCPFVDLNFILLEFCFSSFHLFLWLLLLRNGTYTRLSFVGLYLRRSTRFPLFLFLAKQSWSFSEVPFKRKMGGHVLATEKRKNREEDLEELLLCTWRSFSWFSLAFGEFSFGPDIVLGPIFFVITTSNNIIRYNLSGSLSAAGIQEKSKQRLFAGPPGDLSAMARRYDSRTTTFSPEGRLYQVPARALFTRTLESKQRSDWEH